MTERRRKIQAVSAAPAPLAEVAEVFQEFRRREARIADVPHLYAVNEAGHARTLYFSLRRPQVRADATATASIADIGASGFGALLSKRLHVGEEVRLEALDADDDSLLFDQQYVVRSVRKSREKGEGFDWVAGMQLMAGQPARLFQSFLQSLFIHHLLASQTGGALPEKLRQLFPHLTAADFRQGAGTPASPAKGNVAISLNIDSIQRPGQRPAQPPSAASGTEADAAGRPEAGAAGGEVILCAGHPERTCRAAQALDGLCFSEFEVPQLPLETCNKRLQCNCRLMTFAERRRDERRDDADRREQAGEAGGETEPGRRLGIDRRQRGAGSLAFRPPSRPG